MQALSSHLAGVLAPVLLCVLAGYGFARLKLPFDDKVVGALVAHIGYPTLILSHLTAQHVALDAFLHMMLAALAFVAALGVLGFVALRLLRLPVRGLLSPMMFNNVGNIGLPVCALAFGDAGLAYAMAFVVVVLAGIFTLGIWLPMGKPGLGGVLRKPVIYAVLLALLLMATDTRLPTTIDTTFGLLGGMTIPLMLLTLGHTLATLRVRVLGQSLMLALLHLVLCAGVASMLVRLFGFEGTARGVFIVQCMMPVSVSTYLWVQLHDPEDAPAAAGFVFVSTLLAVITLPAVLGLWV